MFVSGHTRLVLWEARIADAAGQAEAIQIIQHRQSEFPRGIQQVFKLHAFQAALFLKLGYEDFPARFIASLERARPFPLRPDARAHEGFL